MLFMVDTSFSPGLEYLWCDSYADSASQAMATAQRDILSWVIFEDFESIIFGLDYCIK